MVSLIRYPGVPQTEPVSFSNSKLQPQTFDCWTCITFTLAYIQRRKIPTKLTGRWPAVTRAGQAAAPGARLDELLSPG